MEVHCHRSEEVCRVAKRLNVVDPTREITVQINGNKNKKVSIVEWEDNSLKDMTTDYAKDAVACYPPICTSKYSTALLNITNSFEEREEGEQIWLFSEYNLVKHLQFLLGGKKYNNLKEKNVSVLTNLERSNDYFLLFDTKFNSVLLMTVTDTDKASILDEVLQKSTEEMKILLSIYGRHCNAENIRFVSAIFAPNMVRQRDTESYCQYLVMDKMTTSSSDQFKAWYSEHLEFEKESSPDMKPDMKSMKAVIASTLGFSTTKPNCLPSFEKKKDVTYLQLTHDQVKIIMHPKRKKLIFGGYGSGKSVLGK